MNIRVEFSNQKFVKITKNCCLHIAFISFHVIIGKTSTDRIKKGNFKFYTRRINDGKREV